MDNLVDLNPDALQRDLANGLRRNPGLLRELAVKPKHIPGDDYYHAIARRLIEHTKRAGVERVTRRIGQAASVPTGRPSK